MTDYVFRGITQSNHKPSVAAYFEPRYNINRTCSSTPASPARASRSPNRAAAEIDFYGGVRPTFGPLALDFGFWYYYYPGGKCYGGGPLVTACTKRHLAELGNSPRPTRASAKFTPRPTYTVNDWVASAATSTTRRTS